jgi:selenocysteine-specific translation elongation factor
VYESASGKLKGNCVSGKVEGGVLKKDDKFVILPINCQVVVKDIVIGD